MSELIVLLPGAAAGAATEYRFAQTRDGQSVLAQGSAPAATLPRLDGAVDLVAVVPVRALSWHQVELPKGTLKAGAPRLRAVLEGLLEEALLDEPQQLHFALAPQAVEGAPVWVACCDKAWLQQALAPLEAAGRPVSRILPEFAPLLDPSEQQTLHAIGDADDAWLVQCRHSGVTLLPLQAQLVASWLAVNTSQNAALQAEPAVAAQAQDLLNTPAQLQQAAQRWLLSLSGSWDLAQFDLANSSRARALKKFQGWLQELLHAPRWRAARAGLLILVGAHLIGLNAWAWKTQSALDARRAELRAVLGQTFPQVKVVIDAPVQMARELAQLRQSAGAASPQDLESLLSALARATPDGVNMAPTSLEYGAGELRLHSPALRDGQTQDLKARLEAQHLNVKLEADAISLRPAEAGVAR